MLKSRMAAFSMGNSNVVVNGTKEEKRKWVVGAKKLLSVRKRGSADEKNLGPAQRRGRGSQFLTGHRPTITLQGLVPITAPLGCQAF